VAGLENLGQDLNPERAAIVVAGAGWAGCAAAAELALAGKQVVLLEAARSLGGRARGVELDGRLLDNGQHILLGAYRATLDLMQRLGLREEDAFLRLPLQMRYAPQPPAMQFVAPRLPAPLHVLWALLRADGLTRADKLAIARFQSTARWMGWLLYQDCSVAELMERFEQTENTVRLLWRPLCLAALNTPLEQASAQVFLNVLKDSLGARRAASDMLLPVRDLSGVFPERVAQVVAAKGGAVRTGARLTQVVSAGDGWLLELADGASLQADSLVLALPAWQACSVLAHAAPELVPQFEHLPITTVYLQYAETLRLPHPFLALLDEPEASRYGQFVFDRGQLDAGTPGLLAVVISVSDQAAQLPHEALAQAVAEQLAADFKQSELAQPQWQRVVTEKRATFACTPGLQRPPVESGLPNLWLAGDYTAGPYPATLEGAVASGQAAAGALLQSISRTRAKA
jgi:squalene-associated FAD-dependent desaturase